MAIEIDTDRLLQPITGPKPAGRDLRLERGEDAPYTKLRDARSRARTQERTQGFADDDQPAAGAPLKDWRDVYDTAIDVLSDESKDIEIAAWLAEAALRVHGIAGLTAALNIATELLERFWPDIHPPRDPAEDIADRFAAISGFNGEDGRGTLTDALRMANLIGPPFTAPSLAYWQYLQAQSIAKIPDADTRQKRIAQGAATEETFTTAFQGMEDAKLREVHAELKACASAYERLIKAADKLLGADGSKQTVYSGDVTALLAGMIQLMEDKSGGRLSASAVGAAASATPGAAAPAGQARAGAASSKEEALRAVSAAAEFFKFAEPHSIIGPALESIVRQARMPFLDLLRDLIPDEAARGDFLLRAGIRVAKEKS